MLKDKSLYIGIICALFGSFASWLLSDVTPSEAVKRIMPYLFVIFGAIGVAGIVILLLRLVRFLLTRKQRKCVESTLEMLTADGKNGFTTANGFTIHYVPEYSVADKSEPNKKEFSAAEYAITCPRRKDYPITDGFGTCPDVYCPHRTLQNCCSLFGSALQALQNRINSKVMQQKCE